MPQDTEFSQYLNAKAVWLLYLQKSDSPHRHEDAESFRSEGHNMVPEGHWEQPYARGSPNLCSAACPQRSRHPTPDNQIAAA